MGNYGDYLVETDHRGGQLLDALDRKCHADGTVFASDNCAENNYRDWIELYDHHANGSWRGGKRDLYEGGHRVPLLVRWPDVVRPATRTDALVGQVDLLATLAELLELPLAANQAEDSISFAAVLRGEHDADRSARTSLVHHCERIESFAVFCAIVPVLWIVFDPPES